MPDTDRLQPLTSRREVLKHTLSAGFALAVTPIAATAFATDAEGLEAGEVSIPTSTGDIPGYRALPLKPKAKVLFMHTGGLPSLDVYQDVVLGRTEVKD